MLSQGPLGKHPSPGPPAGDGADGAEHGGRVLIAVRAEELSDLHVQAFAIIETTIELEHHTAIEDDRGIALFAAQNRGVVAKIILSKVFYFGLFLFLPLFIVGLPAGPYITGFLLMHFVAGIVLTVTFQLAHTVEGTSHPLPDEHSVIGNNWAIHQLNTTVNFARHNKLLSWYLGGLNFQVEHHLFTGICHVHYPAISEIVKSTCEEFGVPYLENKTLGDAVVSHVRTLKRFGKLPDINEALA